MNAVEHCYEMIENLDILGNVMRHITAKRSRARIIEKLLSLGLVSDRKELYKKRKPGFRDANKNMFPKDFGVPDLDEVNDDEEEEDDLDSEDEAQPVWEDGDLDMCNRPLDGSTNKKGVAASNSISQDLIRSLQQEGISGPLLWLQNCLNRTADDREEDGCAQHVPLVPLSEENEDAMEHKGFQKLLRNVGIRPPANEQESFWRIPAKLSPERLRQLATSIGLQGMVDEAKEHPAEEDVLETEEPRSVISEMEESIQIPLGPKRTRLISNDEHESDNQGLNKACSLTPWSLPQAPVMFLEDSSDEDGPRPAGKRKCLRIEEEED
uniref:Uncharacterized protein n=1 Tax=Sphaerodactylus townsendi TaxID=933632 RepID=A0ACB8EKW9_9SAUR